MELLVLLQLSFLYLEEGQRNNKNQILLTGTLAQLVEHLVETQGVAGSNPAGSIDVT